MPVYEPAEDSLLLAKHVKTTAGEILKENPAARVLDMGTGSGMQAAVCIDAGMKKEDILCVDIDKGAVKLAKKKGFNAVLSNLFSGINKKNKFDLIIFNPPYLPEDKTGHDRGRDTTGGRKGDETILRFLNLAKSYLNKNGKIMIALSSFTPRERISKEIKSQKLKMKVLETQNLFFEKLEVWML
ncbi:methyltransferase, partial [Candidatus Pacearchaeota archaeon]|nr:methyltransferase [Candidatus Pacearchaeota archaeon]